MMHYYKTNGGIIAAKNPMDAEEITEEEYKKIKETLKPKELTAEAAERQYWVNVNYAEAVNEKIRERYSISDEFAILRQKDEKPEEYAAYFAYCEECKAFVKQKKQQ